ncbi:hypothetical protein F5Y16DRAFT_406851 [Xylariaceae sp. FL0255]|nr:hypothetical protein F5Y16DRAFT_406851 [Xylariaceae sp. FL0255]
MEEFHLFSTLPTELRLSIWEFALHREAEDRVVVLHDQRVLLFESMRSALLERLESLPLSWTYNDGLFDSIDQNEHINGTVFLSPDYDRFLIAGDEGFEPFSSIENEGTFSGMPDHFAEGERYQAMEELLPINHVSGQLGSKALQAIRNLILFVTFHPEEELDTDIENIEEFMLLHRPHEYDEQGVRVLWQTEIFNGVRNYWHMWLEEDESYHFLDYLSEDGGRLSDVYCMEKLIWQKREPTSIDAGGRFLVNVGTHDNIRRYDSKEREAEEAEGERRRIFPPQLLR